MNIALPALIVFLALLPGFLFRRKYKRVEGAHVDYSPFSDAVLGGIVSAMTLHGAWLLLTWMVFDRYLHVETLLGLLTSSAETQSSAIKRVAADAPHIAAYFSSITVGAWVLAATVRRLAISKNWHRLPRSNWFHSIFHLTHAPWYYVLQAPKGSNGSTDLISVSALVDVAGEPVLYTGILKDYYCTHDGALDRVVLEAAQRRPLSRDRVSEQADGDEDDARFYPIDGDFFVLRYGEMITLNVLYISLEPALEAESIPIQAGASQDT